MITGRWRRASLVVLSLCAWPCFAAPDPSVDQKIATWLAQIDKASERGQYSDVQRLREDLASFAAGVGRPELAARQYEMLLAARPRRAERVKFFTRLGDMRMAMKDFSRAISAYDDALHDSPKDWDANLARSRAFAAADLHARAIESYGRCIELRPREAVPYEEIAVVYEKRGFLDKAISYYEQALARDPKPQIYLHIADCYAHQKNLVKAVAVLGQAKARLPRADYDIRLGEIYQSLGDLKQAALAWEESLKAAPARDDVRLRLMMLYDQLGRQRDSDRLLKMLSETYPQSPLMHYVKALLHYERGQHAAAYQDALRVQQLSPTEAVSHFNELLLSEIRKKS